MRPQPAAQHAAPATVDPALVGTWLLEVRLPSPQGPVAAWWTIDWDGSYTVDAGPFSHAGAMTAAGSNWTLTAHTSDFQDGGRYETPDWATLVMHGRLGIGRWQRRERALVLATAAINGQLVPTEIPAITDAARAFARRWQPDALLGMI